MSTENNLYGNHKVYDPEGTLLFLGNDKRVKWYLDRDLATVLTDVDGAMEIQLTFTPKGKGHSVNGFDEYYLSEKKNICVVSGDNTISLLTKHHVIPQMFRQHFPLELKSKSSHDIVLMRHDKHHDYERHADRFKDELAIEIGIPTISEITAMFNVKLKPAKIASTILRYENEIPRDVLDDKLLEFEIDTGLEPTKENLKHYIDNITVDERFSLKKVEDFGKLMVESYDNLQEFSNRWRAHFLEYADPKFMPGGWDVNRPIELIM